MKKRFFLFAALFLMTFMANAQLIKDRTNGKITIGFDLFTDINTGSKYENFDLRAINQGFDAYITYNLPMLESKHTVSIGLGVSSHNYYMKNAWLSEPYAHSIEFTPLSSCDKSKINFNYMDIPLELNFRIADKFKISFGGKVSFLMSSRSKVIGKIHEADADNSDTHNWEVRYNSLNAVESIVYSAFARFGYRCVNLFVGYQLTGSFKDDRGPEILPFSIGIGIRAY